MRPHTHAARYSCMYQFWVPEPVKEPVKESVPSIGLYGDSPYM
jgi:hypothetical protein